MTSLDEREVVAVAEALAAAGEHLVGPLACEPIARGRSNLTFCLGDGESRWILRMPPRAGRSPSAHDVRREHRVTRALHASAVPVPRAVLLVEDPALLGAEFAVSAFVPGATIQSRAELDALDDAQVDAAVAALVGGLADLHRVEPAEVGLADFARPDAYAARQLRRWSGQWEQVGPARLAGLAGEVVARLERAIPPQRRTSVVHGDYRIDNALLGLGRSEVTLNAVVDWELATLGDPVADVAMMCAYRHPGFDLIVGEPAAWTSPRLPDPTALAAVYEARGGPELEHWDFHTALAHYKVAVIAAGIDYRRRAGAGSGAGHACAGEAVEPFLHAALGAPQRRAE
ncbi:phosphotransferase family protein [Nocardioides acrostichi]|uniref:Phosphotransferase family protein n=1 Tax=Nocardioides acrostichi TaxID=2784339 RepID=A0A930V404_9ACTN|nr:phosphotransferase family protein [Nocardioides acrostichi]MBF4163305.1 phosphotransferase family protein [Nocardioides acrostichi]